MLTEILNLDIYRFFVLFSRIGTVLMFMPGIAGRLVSTRFRLILALMIAYVMMPVLAPGLPPMPNHLGGLIGLIAGEVAVGVFLGMVIQALLSAVHVTGTFIGFQVGLTNAFAFDPIVEQQGQLLTGFLSNLAVAVILATDLHHLMLRAVVDSYELFRPAQPLPWNDMTETLVRTITGSFDLGVKLSAPLVVFGLVFYTAMGLLSRLVPQMQVFFVALPAQVLMGLWMFMVSLPAVVFLFLRWFEDGLIPFLVPR